MNTANGTAAGGWGIDNDYGPLRDVLLGVRQPRFREEPDVTFTATLNESQQRAVRFALSAEDVDSPDYEEGVSCPHCINASSADQKAAFRERQRQVTLAAARGERHVGARMPG